MTAGSPGTMARTVSGAPPGLRRQTFPWYFLARGKQFSGAAAGFARKRQCSFDVRRKMRATGASASQEICFLKETAAGARRKKSAPKPLACRHFRALCQPVAR